MEERFFYFAYGSNMNTHQLKDRIGDFGKGKKVILMGYDLRFNKRGKDGSGKANILLSPGSVIEGVIFNVSKSQVDKLDKHEAGYHRKKISLLLHDKKISAITYIADIDKICENLLPHKDYADTIIKGAEYFGLFKSYIDELKNLKTK